MVSATKVDGMICFYCRKRDNGSQDSDEPCSTCDDWMEKGIILISYSPELTKEEGAEHRTGGWVVVQEDFVRDKMRFFPQPEVEQIVQQRCALLSDWHWDAWKLPRDSKPN
jgi:hypothetical protein